MSDWRQPEAGEFLEEHQVGYALDCMTADSARRVYDGPDAGGGHRRSLLNADMASSDGCCMARTRRKPALRREPRSVDFTDATRQVGRREQRTLACRVREKRDRGRNIADDRSMTRQLLDAAPAVASPVGRATHELALHKALLEAAPLFLARPREARIAVHEFALRGPRPDVCIADVDLDLFGARRAAAVRPTFNSAVAAVVAALRERRGQVSPDWTIERAAAFVGGAAARRAFKTLLREGSLTSTGRGVLLSEAIAKPALHCAVAIEAKVNKWRSAAQQAHRWRLAVDEAWLAFPTRYVRSIPLDLPGLQCFGLAAVSDDSVERSRMAPIRRADAFNRALTEQYLYARWLDEVALEESVVSHGSRLRLATAL